MCVIQKTTGKCPARDNRETNQSIITYTLLRLAGFSVICDLTSQFPPLAEVLTGKMMCQ